MSSHSQNQSKPHTAVESSRNGYLEMVKTKIMNTSIYSEGH